MAHEKCEERVLYNCEVPARRFLKSGIYEKLVKLHNHVKNIISQLSFLFGIKMIFP